MNPEPTTLCRLTGQSECQGVSLPFPPEQGGAYVTVIPPTASTYLRVREAWNIVRLAEGKGTHGDQNERAGDRWTRDHWRDCAD
jgi:hypothetical protein